VELILEIFPTTRVVTLPTGMELEEDQSMEEPLTTKTLTLSMEELALYPWPMQGRTPTEANVRI
jgi:hypothetical protein